MSEPKLIADELPKSDDPFKRYLWHGPGFYERWYIGYLCYKDGVLGVSYEPFWHPLKRFTQWAELPNPAPMLEQLP